MEKGDTVEITQKVTYFVAGDPEGEVEVTWDHDSGEDATPN